jgi:phosphopantetheinyl transferase (holo-ACP synthase)
MIFGIGTDIVEVSRIEDSLQRFGEFYRKLKHQSQ